MNRFACILLSAILISCGGGDKLFEDIPIRATLIVEDQDEVLQIDVTNTSENIQITSLTEELGVRPNDYSFIDVNNTLVSFTGRGSIATSVWQKDISNNSTLVLDDYCELDFGESPDRAGFSRDYVVLSTIKFNEINWDIILRIYDKAGLTCQEVTVGTGIPTNTSSLLVTDEFAFILYENDQFKVVIKKVDLVDGTVSDGIILDRGLSATVINDELLIFQFDESWTLTRYDLLAFSVNSTEKLTSFDAFGPGFFRTQSNQKEIVLFYYYAQPSPIVGAPVVFDLELSEYTTENLGYMFDLVQEVQENIEASIGIIDHDIDIDRNLIALAFVNSSFGAGGVIYTNFSGEILGVVELDYTPQEIILR